MPPAAGLFVVVEICFGITALVAVGLSLRRSHLRAHPRAVAMPPGFEKTAERLLDPVSGVLQAVWYNPRTGERRYQPLASAAHPDRR